MIYITRLEDDTTTAEKIIKLCKEKPRSRRELAIILNRNENTITRQLKSLYREGYLSFKSNNNNPKCLKMWETISD